MKIDLSKPERIMRRHALEVIRILCRLFGAAFVIAAAKEEERNE